MLISVLAYVSSEVLAYINKIKNPGVHYVWGTCFLQILSQVQIEPGLRMCELFALYKGSSVCVCVCVCVCMLRVLTCAAHIKCEFDCLHECVQLYLNVLLDSCVHSDVDKLV